MTEETSGMVRVSWGVGAEVIGADFDAIGKLAQAMSATIADVGGVAKDGLNKDQGYAYQTAGDVDAAVGAAMSKHGLAFGLSADEMTQDRDPQAKRAYSRVWWRWIVFCADGGAMLTGRWVSESLDFGTADKGLNKAATAAAKYLKLKLFMVAVADEADADAGGDEQGQRQEWQQAAQGATRQAQPAKTAQGAPVVYGGGVGAVVKAIQDKAAQLTAQGYQSQNLEGFQKAQLGNMIAALMGQGENRDNAEVGAHAVISVLFGVGHFGDLTAPQCSALGRWLQTKSETGQYVSNPRSAQELSALVQAIDAGVFDNASEPEPEAQAEPF